jgi:hypothetical protein
VGTQSEWWRVRIRTSGIKVVSISILNSIAPEKGTLYPSIRILLWVAVLWLKAPLNKTDFYPSMCVCRKSSP